MTDNELILQKLTELQNNMDSRFLNMDDRFLRIEEKLNEHSEILHEHSEIFHEHSEMLQDIKTATNNLIDWAEDVGKFTQLPFGKAE